MDKSGSVASGIIWYASVMGAIAALFFGAWWWITGYRPTLTPHRRSVLARRAMVIALACTWFAISVSFSLFNKFMYSVFQNGEFHYPLLITSGHLFVKGLGALTVLKARGCAPLKWPTRRVFLRKIVPIGILTGLDIALNQWAYLVAAVSLCTVVRAMGILFTLALSLCLRLVRFRKSLAVVIAAIACGSVLAVWKEPEFNAFGAFLMLLSGFCGSLRWVLTQTVLSTKEGDKEAEDEEEEEKTDVLHLILFLSPSAFLSAFTLALGFEVLPRGHLASNWSAITDADPAFLGTLLAIALAGGVLALLLLVVQTRLIEMLDALSTDVIAKMKDATLIILSLFIYGEHILPVNVVGVVCMIAGTCMYREVRRRDAGGASGAPPRRAYSVVSAVEDEAEAEGREEEEVDEEAGAGRKLMPS